MPAPSPTFPSPVQGSLDSEGIRYGRTLHLPENTNQPPAEISGYSCTLTWEGNEFAFSPDPVRVQWGLTGQVNLMITRGGQVAYSSGRTIGPLVIMGYLRSRTDLLELGSLVGQHMRDAQLLGLPARFTYPERQIDFGVYVQNMNEIGLDGEQGEIVGYTITCIVTEDHTALSQAEQSYLSAIPENITWVDVEQAAAIAESRFGGSGTSGSSGEDTPAEETEVSG